MAEDTLKALPDEVRVQKLPALALKLREKIRKQEQDRFDQAARATAAAPPMPPPPPKAPTPEPTPLAKALSAVPGVLGQPSAISTSMVTNSILQLQAGVTRVGLRTAGEAERIGMELSGALGPMAPNGMHMEEVEINDYPQIARQKISHREPLQQIEELTGSRVQVKGQHFATHAKMPEGARKLYVEVVGPTVVAVQKGKQEVIRMMEALAIRTLNIPGLSRAQMGTPGRYDPAVGK
uniref:ATP-dependent RNA helicase PRP5/DDX46/KHDC4 KH domain-containing protein n=1 Tax=Strombidinopsis acuminata TaxID=141414 RepID=A0A7S3WIJ2_9SPIT